MLHLRPEIFWSFFIDKKRIIEYNNVRGKMKKIKIIDYFPNMLHKGLTEKEIKQGQETWDELSKIVKEWKERLEKKEEREGYFGININ